MAKRALRLVSLYSVFALGLVAVLSAQTIAADGLSPEKVLQPRALNHTGVYELRQIDPNLTGADVNVAVVCRSITYIDGEPQNDYRPNTEHNCFSSTAFGFHDYDDLSAGVSAHSTAVCSLLFGKDPNASDSELGQFNYQGVVPDAGAGVYEFWHFLTNNVFTHTPPAADVVTACMGNPFEDWWTRGIESLAEHYGLVVVTGAGNGSDAFDPVLYPAAGANVIGVGVVDSVMAAELATRLEQFALASPQHSSFGPTVDGRCKPDIVAPGNCMTAVADDNNSYEPAGDFSSYSTPLVAGTAGLLIQKAKQDPNLAEALSPVGRTCLIKAVLLNSAKKLPFWHKGRLERDDNHTAPLDYIQGAGMLNALGAYEQLIAGQNGPGNAAELGWDINIVGPKAPGKAYSIDINVPAGKMITATCVWNRHYENRYPFGPLAMSDLRLELHAIDHDDPNHSYQLDYSDSRRDNVEHIYTELKDDFHSYRLVVSFNTKNDANQADVNEPYALTWSVSDQPNDDSIFWYDLNADGVVDDSDAGAALYNWLEATQDGNWYFLGDINGDGRFDPNDLRMILEQKGQTADWLTN